MVDSPERKLAQQYKLTRRELVAEQTQSPEDENIQQAVEAFQKHEQILADMETYLNPITMKSQSNYRTLLFLPFPPTLPFLTFDNVCFLFFYFSLVSWFPYVSLSKFKTQRLVLSSKYSSPYAATIPHSINICTSSSQKHEKASPEELEREIQRLEAAFKAVKDPTQHRSI